MPRLMSKDTEMFKKSRVLLNTAVQQQLIKTANKTSHNPNLDNLFLTALHESNTEKDWHQYCIYRNQGERNLIVLFKFFKCEKVHF